MSHQSAHYLKLKGKTYYFTRRIKVSCFFPTTASFKPFHFKDPNYLPVKLACQTPSLYSAPCGQN